MDITIYSEYNNKSVAPSITFLFMTHVAISHYSNALFDDSKCCIYSAQITKKLKKKIELALTELFD